MKERLKGILSGVLIGLLISSGTVYAASDIITKELHYNNIKISLNGEEVMPLDANGSYVEPFIIDGTTYLPVRAIANALGLQVAWDDTTKTVMLSGGTDTSEEEDSQTSNAYFKCYTDKQIPKETGSRQFTDSELLEMSDVSVSYAAEKITTLADAYAWLYYAGYVQGGMRITSRTSLIHNDGYSGNKKPSWLGMSTVLHILLEGDYDDVGTILCVSQPRSTGWPLWYYSFNYVMVNGIYYITYSVDHLPCSGIPLYDACTIETNDLTLVKDALESLNGSLALNDLITIAALGLLDETIQYEIIDAPSAVTFPYIEDVRYLYQADEAAYNEYVAQKEAEAAAEEQMWERRAPTLKISDYNLPAAIGNTTLTYDEALELVGKEPAVIAERVKTVGDILQYMIAARFGYNSPSAYTPWYSGWGFDAPGDDQLRQNYGCCCGGYANTVSYLIDGDYEKAGTLRWVGNGNHTISWVYVDGKYYVFDFTQLCNGGNYNNKRADFTVLDDLRDYYDVYPQSYQDKGAKEDIAVMVAFEVDGGAMYPSVWRDPPNFTGLTFPSEAEGKITVIHQQNAEYGVFYKDVPENAIPRYNGE